MGCGALNRRLTFEANTPSRDALGQPIESWSTLATVWAAIDYGNGGEKIENDREIHTSKITFTVRYRADVSVKNRILFEGEYYDIRDIREVTTGFRQMYLEVDAEKYE